MKRYNKRRLKALLAQVKLYNRVFFLSLVLLFLINFFSPDADSSLGVIFRLSGVLFGSFCMTTVFILFDLKYEFYKDYQRAIKEKREAKLKKQRQKIKDLQQEIRIGYRILKVSYYRGSYRISITFEDEFYRNEIPEIIVDDSAAPLVRRQSSKKILINIKNAVVGGNKKMVLKREGHEEFIFKNPYYCIFDKLVPVWQDKGPAKDRNIFLKCTDAEAQFSEVCFYPFKIYVSNRHIATIDGIYRNNIIIIPLRKIKRSAYKGKEHQVIIRPDWALGVEIKLPTPQQFQT